MTALAAPPTPPTSPPPGAGAGTPAAATADSPEPARASEPARAKDAASSQQAQGSIESAVMSYRVLSALGTAIADTLTGRLKEGACVILQDADGVAALAAYRAFLSRTDLLIRAFEAVTAPEKDVDAIETDENSPKEIHGHSKGHEMALLPAAVGAIKLAAPVVSKAFAWLTANKAIGATLSGISNAIRPQSVITHEAVTIDDDALAAEISGTLTRRGRDVCFPRFAPIEMRDPDQDLAMITDAFDRIWDASTAASERLGPRPDKVVSGAHTHLEALEKLTSTLQTEMLGGGTTSSLSVVMSGAARARILGEDGHWLFLKVRQTGATPRTTTRFGRQATVEYASGAVATYFLFDLKGSVVLSGTETRYRSFRELGDD